MEPIRAVPLTCHGHSRPVTHLSFSDVVGDSEYYLLSTCKDNNPMLRDGATGDWIGTFFGHKGATWQGRLSSDGQLAATASADFTARVWNTNTGECLHTFQQPHIVRAVAFPRQVNPPVLALGGFEKKLMIYELDNRGTGSSPTSPNQASFAQPHNGYPTPAGYEIGAGSHQGAIKSVLWTKESNVLITACEDKHVRWFDIRSRNAIAQYPVEGVIGSCELSSSLSTLAVAAGKKAYFFSGAAPGQLIKAIRQPTEIVSVALHEGQRKYVTGGNQDTWLRVWSLDAAEGSKELDVWKGHHGPTWNLSFSPDGKVCASGSEDGTVKLWKFCEGPYGLWR